MIPTMRTPRSLMLEASIAVVRRLSDGLGAGKATGADGPAPTTERATELVIVAPQQREQSEIVWYPQTVAWARLQQGAPLLFWPLQERVAGRSTEGKPLIAVPLDGHALAERAVPLACALAEEVDGEVVLVHVAPRAAADPAATALQRDAALQRLREARRYLRAARARATARTCVAVSTKLLLGEPGRMLVAFTRWPSIGAVVMTTHSQVRAKRFFAGAVATRVVREAATLTLLVPLGPETESPGRYDRVVRIPVTR